MTERLIQLAHNYNRDDSYQPDKDPSWGMFRALDEDIAGQIAAIAATTPGLQEYARYSYSADQSSNYSATDAFFTPESGIYMIAGYWRTTLASAGAFGFGMSFTVKQGASSYLSGGINLEALGSNNGGGFFQLINADDGALTIDRSASSYGGNTAHAIAEIVAYKLT